MKILRDDVLLAFLHSGFWLPELAIFILQNEKMLPLPSKELVVHTINILNIHFWDFLWYCYQIYTRIILDTLHFTFLMWFIYFLSFFVIY